MHLNKAQDFFRCSNKVCDKKLSITHETIFENKHACFGTTLMLGYVWLGKASVNSAAAWT